MVDFVFGEVVDWLCVWVDGLDVFFVEFVVVGEFEYVFFCYFFDGDDFVCGE